jgi:hypothetical protein
MRIALVPALAFTAVIFAACSDATDQRSLTGNRRSVEAAEPAGSASDPSTGGATPDGEDPVPAEEDAPAPATDGGAKSADAGGADAGKNNCIDGVASPGSGKHHAGDDCLGCHDTQSKRWTISGTLYSAATGGTAVAGATIEVVDATGKVVKLTTYSNGNFYTTTAVTKPLKVRATKCPSDRPMIGAVNDGSCNGCHNSSMRIF